MPTLNWIGKDKVTNHHNEVPYRLLEWKYSYGNGEKSNEDNGSENMIIHGDNLEALKSLLPKFEGRIKCIYIDPPYNTAKSSEKNKAWVYSDSMDDPKMLKWLGNAVGDEGEDLSRHDKWLCMIYPRLRLIQKLLSKDGIIFISIDDNECANLRIVCDEIFGKHNFVSQLVWKTDGNFDNQAKIKNVHEYILCYTKMPNVLGLPNGIDPTSTETSKIYNDEIRNTVVKNGPKNPMSLIELPVGFPCSESSLYIKKRKDAFPYYYDDAIIENGKLKNKVVVESGWASKNILMNFIDNHFMPVLDSKGQETIFEITKTGAIEMIKKREKVSHVLSVLQSLGSTQSMSTELLKMGIKFDFPKPNSLIEYILGFYADEDSIILDSFAGSGTTAHAVLNMNKADGGNRKFILIEMMDYAESITAERVRRVIDGYGEGNKEVEGVGGNFSFYELGERLILENGDLNPSADVEKIRDYIWYMETKTGYENSSADDNAYFLSTYNEVAYYFYYEKEMVTTLDRDFLSTVKTKADNYVVYADMCALSDELLQKYNITFKKIPRDIAKL